MKKILFTTIVGDPPNYFYTLSQKKYFRIDIPVPPFGVRFLAANIPEIEVLEFPSWDRFKRSLEDVDILGISFLMREIPVMKDMVTLARSVGVQTIFGGGYGVLGDDVGPLFDELYYGHAEDAVSSKLFGRGIDRLKHPSLITSIGIPHVPLKKYAYLFTARGCRIGCTFCQTPVFVPKVSSIPIESIAEVLRTYKQERVHTVMILDENFNPGSAHSGQVIELIQEHGFEWGCMTRADYLKGKVAYLRDTGFSSCIIGLESLSQERLDFIRKKEKIENMVATVEELRSSNVTVHATFMVGYPEDTESLIKQELISLAALDIQSCQIFILTPYPQTPLWHHIEQDYGIFEQDHARYDGLHLVWNHPQISPETMRQLVRNGYHNFYTKKRLLKHLLQPLVRKLKKQKQEERE